MANASERIREQLFALQDPVYRQFQGKLIPGVDPARIIGVRTPALRNLAKALADTPDAAEFLSAIPHAYYDENNLHGFLLERFRDYDAAVAAVDAFLPYVDNWATCDLLSPKAFRKNPDALDRKIPVWMSSERVYTVRFGIGMRMTHFLDARFLPEYLAPVAAIRSEEYYINMMCAWFFATALAKQYDAALPYLTERRLPQWVHNKTIQKAVESYRISDVQKAYLRTLRIR